MAKTEPFKITRIVGRSGRYGHRITLDPQFCKRNGVKVGTVLSQFDHPTKKGILCLEIAKK